MVLPIFFYLIKETKILFPSTFILVLKDQTILFPDEAQMF